MPQRSAQTLRPRDQPTDARCSGVLDQGDMGAGAPRDREFFLGDIGIRQDAADAVEKFEQEFGQDHQAIGLFAFRDGRVCHRVAHHLPTALVCQPVGVGRTGQRELLARAAHRVNLDEAKGIGAERCTRAPVAIASMVCRIVSQWPTASSRNCFVCGALDCPSFRAPVGRRFLSAAPRIFARSAWRESAKASALGVRRVSSP